MEQITIMYYEDNNSLREGMSFLIGNTPSLKLLQSYSNCDEIEAQMEVYQPDVVLMDIDLPGINGIEAIKKIKSISRKIEVIMLTVFDDEEKIFKAIQNGATGYLLKSSSPSEIIQAIFDIRNGGSPMTSNVARKVLQHLHQPVPNQDFSLTDRELEIIQGLMNGYSYKLIAYDLNIKIDTVRSHIRSIYDKLQVNSKTEAILKVIENNIFKK